MTNLFSTNYLMVSFVAVNHTRAGVSPSANWQSDWRWLSVLESRLWLQDQSEEPFKNGGGSQVGLRDERPAAGRKAGRKDGVALTSGHRNRPKALGVARRRAKVHRMMDASCRRANPAGGSLNPPPTLLLRDSHGCKRRFLACCPDVRADLSA